MDNIVAINKLNYKFIIKPTFHTKITRSGNELEQLCLIGVKDNFRNRLLIHHFSEFVLKLKKRSYSSMKNRAETIVRFLNFVLENNHKYKITTFADLNKSHGTDYINNLVRNERSLSYVNTEDNNLTKFYYFLADKELLNSISTTEFKFIFNKNPQAKAGSLDTFFPDTENPSSKKTKRPLHTLQAELLVLFLELAKKFIPRNALGVYFQVMGGLRPSEVCNCTRTGISLYGQFGEFGMNVTLQTQNFRARPSRVATSVKKPRVQSIEVFNDYLPNLFQTHIKNYLPTDGTLALFSNNSGQAITLQTYCRNFGKLKKEFIKTLASSSDPKLQAYAITLQSIKWGAHIGRGIFSNIMSEVTQSPIITKLKRGDKNIKSQECYMENTPTRKQQHSTAMDRMYEDGEKVLESL